MPAAQDAVAMVKWAHAQYSATRKVEVPATTGHDDYYGSTALPSNKRSSGTMDRLLDRVREIQAKARHVLGVRPS